MGIWPKYSVCQEYTSPLAGPVCIQFIVLPHTLVPPHLAQISGRSFSNISLPVCRRWIACRVYTYQRTVSPRSVICPSACWQEVSTSGEFCSDDSPRFTYRSRELTRNQQTIQYWGRHSTWPSAAICNGHAHTFCADSDTRFLCALTCSYIVEC